MSAPLPEQLLLDLCPPPAPTLDNFVVGANSEALHALEMLLQPSLAERCIYLWGVAGSGRSHLLRAMSSAANGRYFQCLPKLREFPTSQTAEIASDFRPNGIHGDAWNEGETSQSVGSTWFWAIDDVENAAPELQIALFNLINEVRDDATRCKAIVIAGNSAPLALALREDLRTRLGWGLVFQLRMLSDDDKDAALAQRAEERGVALPPEVRRYLLRNFSRDLNSLMSVVDALDVYGMRRQRALTIPLLRELALEMRVADAAFSASPAVGQPG